MDSFSELPEPSAEEQSISQTLAALIRGEIDQHGGRLPFDRFMELALYAPGLGYYMAGRQKFGAGGDFVTAPEISPLFSRCLARQCEQVLAGLGGGSILEFGAGSGVLAADLLASLQEAGRLPETYLILEPSAELQQRQRESLERKVPALVERVSWLQGLPQDFRGVVLANEVLDAMPVHRFRMGRTGVEEFFVVAGETGFAELASAPQSAGLQAAVEELRTAGLALDEGYQSEINLRLGPWLRSLDQCVSAGIVLLVDYGYSRDAYYHSERSAGTLMCHYRHRAHPDPYRLVGLQDITAHVDFSAVADEAFNAGFIPAGYATQAHFLLSTGLEEFMLQSDPEDVARHLDLVQQVKRLTLPSEMGEQFKVMMLARGFEEPLLGGRFRDLRDRL